MAILLWLIHYFRPYLYSTRPLLTHYTNTPDAIRFDDKLKSHEELKRCRVNFKASSSGDIKELGNSEFVFFRFELAYHVDAASRFGKYAFIIPASSTSLMQSGWVSLHDMGKPSSASINMELFLNDSLQRSNHAFEYSSSLLFKYFDNSQREMHPEHYVFYGTDILYGLAVSMLAELRHFSPDVQAKYLKNPSLADLNYLTSRLFRVEAKISTAVDLSGSNYTIHANKVVYDAVMKGDIAQLKSLVALNVEIHTNTYTRGTIIDEIIYCKNLPDNIKEVMDFLFLTGASWQSNGEHLVFVAVSANAIKVVEYAIETNPELLTCVHPPGSGRTLLIAAQEEDHAELCHLLVKSGSVSALGGSPTERPNRRVALEATTPQSRKPDMHDLRILCTKILTTTTEGTLRRNLADLYGLLYNHNYIFDRFNFGGEKVRDENKTVKFPKYIKSILEVYRNDAKLPNQNYDSLVSLRREIFSKAVNAAGNPPTYLFGMFNARSQSTQKIYDAMKQTYEQTHGERALDP